MITGFTAQRQKTYNEVITPYSFEVILHTLFSVLDNHKYVPFN